MTKPDCYVCVHRRNIIGDAHSSCVHPDNFASGLSSIILSMLGTVPWASTSMDLTGDPYAIKNGWFNHPINFDPLWLLSCNGFTKTVEIAKSD